MKYWRQWIYAVLLIHRHINLHLTAKLSPLLVEKSLSHETGAGLVLGGGGWGWVCYVSVWL